MLIDDDGEVWLRDPSANEPLQRATTELTDDMDSLGRLLAFLSTGNGGHLDAGSVVDVATLPPPLPTVAGRLFSRNGSCYRSYAELAREAAALRGLQVELATPLKETAAVDVSFEPEHPPLAAAARDVTEPLPMHSESIAADRREESEESPQADVGDRNWLGVAVLVLLVLGALAAYAAWG